MQSTTMTILMDARITGESSPAGATEYYDIHEYRQEKQVFIRCRCHWCTCMSIYDVDLSSIIMSKTYWWCEVCWYHDAHYRYYRRWGCSRSLSALLPWLSPYMMSHHGIFAYRHDAFILEMKARYRDRSICDIYVYIIHTHVLQSAWRGMRNLGQRPLSNRSLQA